MTDIFDEVRIIAADTKGLSGEDRKKLVRAADEYDRLAATLNAKAVNAPNAPAMTNLNEYDAVMPAATAIEATCSEFVVSHTNHQFNLVCAKQRFLQHKHDIRASAGVFEIVVLMRTSPQSAKDLLIALVNQINSYEATYGAIVTDLTQHIAAMQPASPQSS